MVEWDTSKSEGEMLEVARAMLILPSSGWDLLDPEVSVPAPGESHVVSFVFFHLIRFRVPVHPFVGRFFRHFGLWLHDLTSHGVTYLAVFVTLCECYLGIEPHIDLGRWIFCLNLNKDGDGSVQRIGITAIKLRNNLKLRYLELFFPTSEKGWHQKWFYLSDPSGSLLAFSPYCLGLVVPPSWKSLSEGPALKVTEGLLGQITALKDARLTGWMVFWEFLFHRTLSLMARPTPMWEYVGVGDPSVVAEGNLLEESVAGVAWMVLGSTLVEPTVGEGLAPFLTV
jgi:hypothetical protein